jgi:hypothetical protein
MTDQSRLAKFHTGDLVMYGGFVYILDHNSGKDDCHIKRFEILFPVPERFLRKLTFAEFAWFRNPVTGHMNCGKTRGFMAITIHIAALIVFFAGFTVDGPWKIAPFAIGAGVLAIFWIGTRANFTGKWV